MADERGRARIVQCRPTFSSRRHERGIDLYDDIVKQHQHLACRVLSPGQAQAAMDIAMHV
jgi:hypothetical protein